ncbi:MAG TPA: hypothetical protein VFF06_27090 [Polyangia bacterium]|nr:hypothetical protein [Polyangia bacterium]
MTRAPLTAFALAFALAGCDTGPAKFPVVITAMTDDGKPFPNLPVTLGRAAAGSTDADGHLRVHVTGSEGMKVAVSVAAPKGFKVVSLSDSLVLRRLTDIEGGSEKLLPVEHTVKLAPLERQYAVLVRAGVAGLPIETFGTRQAVTNSKGVAMFTYRGAPGDELQVKINTDGHPELRPQNPPTSFLLASRSEAYVFKVHFGVQKATVKKHKPVHIGPRRL